MLGFKKILYADVLVNSGMSQSVLLQVRVTAVLIDLMDSGQAFQ